MIHFIYNPISGKGKARRIRKVIEERLRALDVPFCFHPTSGTRDAERIARMLTEGGEREIVAMGGDGTIHEVLNGLVDPSKAHLGIVPCGSGNDFACAIGIPMDAKKALQIILSGSAKPTDYLRCDRIRGMNVIGAGIDVEVLKYSYRARLLHGTLNYVLSLLRAVMHFKFYKFSTLRDGKAGRHDGMIVCACNGQRIGGGIQICPGAHVDDGQMELMLVEGIEKKQIPAALLSLARGKILTRPYAKHEYLKNLQVKFDEPTTIQIDGELYENIPFDVSIVPGGISIYRN